MALDIDDTRNKNLDEYRRVRAQAITLVDAVQKWEASFVALRAIVTPDDQLLLDNKKTQFITPLRNALGI